MSGMFNPENKVMQIGAKFADLLLVNALTLILSVPIVTSGAAYAAMHNIVLKIYRDEEAGIIKSYWKAFKENLKQGIKLFLIYLLVGAVLAADIYMIASDTLNWGTYFNLFVVCITVIYLVSFIWVFVLQSRYDFTIKELIKYSLVLGFRNLPASAAMIILFALPFFLFLTTAGAIPFVLLIGITLPALLQAILYSRVFDRFEGVDKRSRTDSDE